MVSFLTHFSLFFQVAFPRRRARCLSLSRELSPSSSSPPWHRPRRGSYPDRQTSEVGKNQNLLLLRRRKYIRDSSQSEFCLIIISFQHQYHTSCVSFSFDPKECRQVQSGASYHSQGFQDKNLKIFPRPARAVDSYSSGPPAGGIPQIFKTLQQTGWKAPCKLVFLPAAKPKNQNSIPILFTRPCS